MQPGEHLEAFIPPGYSHIEIENASSENLLAPTDLASGQVTARQTAANPVSSILPKQYEIQQEIQEQAVRDDRLWSYVSIIIVSLGVLLILLGVAFVFFSHNILLAALSGGSGVATDAISLLILNSRREARERADAVSAQIDKREHVIFLRHQIETSPDIEMRKRAMEAYIEQFASPQTSQHQAQQNQIKKPGRKKNQTRTDPSSAENE